ncbi:MAG: hypothetical protein JWO90_2534 [Solirubrobacterales bacterium]|jgi:hypothetical protein|nr:hypothetical protein [Solirubrobacterales bacterium]
MLTTLLTVLVVWTAVALLVLPVLLHLLRTGARADVEGLRLAPEPRTQSPAPGHFARA